MSSDDDSFGLNPLGGSLHYRKMSASPAASSVSASAASTPRVYATASQLADKYSRQHQQQLASPAASSPAAVAVPASPSVSSPRGLPVLSVARPSSRAASSPLQPIDLDDSHDSANPGSNTREKTQAQPSQQRRQAQPQSQQPGGSDNDASADDFFTETPFLPVAVPPAPASPISSRAPATTAAASSSSPSQTRYSYLDPKGSGRVKRRASSESNPSSDEESAFKAKIRPLGSSLWNKSIEPRQARPQQQQQQQQKERRRLPASPSSPRARSTPQQSVVRLEPYSPSSRAQSPLPVGADSFQGQSDLSREYQQLHQAWTKQEDENRQLKDELKQQQVQPLSQPINVQLQLHPQAIVTSPAPSASATTEHDALRALQSAQRADRAANESATRGFLLNDSYYPNNVELHEVLADHKRLRQRLRAAQHAIEALAAGSEPGAVDGAASLASAIRGADASRSPSGRAHRGYMPALQAPPSSLSLSQYAHLPPARAVLKLLHRLEREEEAFLADRESWRAEKQSIGATMGALTADLRHLTSLAQQAQENEIYFRQREADHATTLARLHQEREAERQRWAEVEKDLRSAGLRERIRFNADVAKLERNDTHFKAKYDAAMTLLRRYEHERQVPPHAADQIAQQKRMFEIFVKEAEEEKARLLERVETQEQRYGELQKQVNQQETHADARLRETRAELAHEQQRRAEAEAQLRRAQQDVTRNLDQKLHELQSVMADAPLVQSSAKQQQQHRSRAPSAERFTAESVGAEIARAYAAEAAERRRTQEEELEESDLPPPPPQHTTRTRRGSRHRQHEREPPTRSHSRPHSRSRSRATSRTRYVASSASEDEYSQDDRSVSPPPRSRPRSHSRPRSSADSLVDVPVGRAHFRPSRVSAAQQILSMLPGEAQVRGDIEFVLPDDGADPFYANAHAADAADAAREERHRARVKASSSRGRSRERDHPRYARPTFSSDHAAALAERLYAPSQPRSRSHSASVSPARIRREVDRRVRQTRGVVDEDQFYTPAAAARRARSHSRTSQHRDRTEAALAASASRVGPAVNGHSGVTIRVVKQVQPPGSSSARTSSSATKAQSAKRAARQAYQSAWDQYEYDRYGRVSDARYV